MPAKPFVRREARSLPAGDETIPAYARAVRAMLEKPDTDPTSWYYQAAMHGTAVKPDQKLWNGCKHYSWWFLAWHRMYVYYFERIVRQVVIETGGPEDWALPYWNYCLQGEHAEIPDPFRDQRDAQGNPNPLFRERAPGINTGVPLRDEYTTPKFALARPQFVGAPEFGGGIASPNPQFSEYTGEVEETPHNAVHNGLGGLMRNPLTAAQDPIFWLHHANIDRLWVEWIALGHSDPSEPTWLGQKFEFFDVGGGLVALTPAQILDTVKDLDYEYDLVPAAATEAAAAPEPEPQMPIPTPEQPQVIAATAEGMTLVGDRTEVTVKVGEKAKPQMLAATAETEPQRLFLNIEEVEGEVNPGSVYGIYVNLPADADKATKAEHHVGNLSFFGIERSREQSDDAPGHSVTSTIEIGDRLRALNGGRPWGEEEVTVTLLPLPLIAPEGADREVRAELASAAAEDPPIQVGRVSLSVA